MLRFALASLMACATPEPRPGELRVMAYNVLYDAPDPAASVSLIEEQEPDFVCLREVRPPFLRAMKRLHRRYPHRVLQPKSHGTWGAALFSKHPIVRWSAFPEKPMRLPALEATIAVDGSRIDLACLHLMPPAALDQLAKNASIREQQAKHIVKRYRAQRGALVLLGDFNEELGEATDVFTQAEFADACRAGHARCSATWPGATTVWPAITRIDKVLGRNVKFSHSWVPAGGGSDHQPIVAVIDLGK